MSRMKKSSKIIVGILFFIVFCIVKTVVGNWKYDFFEELFPELMIVVIISFFMMIIPLCYVLIKRKNRNVKKIRNVCVVNSILLEGFVFIRSLVTIFTYEEKYITSFDVIGFAKIILVCSFIISAIYFCINYIIFCSKGSE